VGFRILLGAGAWVLGTATATGGSLFAIEQMGQHLLAQRSTQVSVATVNAELVREHSEPAMSAPSTAPARTPSAKVRHGAKRHRSAALPPAVLLDSADGSAAARCQEGGAYLVYWSPQQGYEADHVIRGPAAVAQVTFSNGFDGDVLQVTCRAGAPVKHVSALRSGPPHDE
jgi:hypothetical protein